MQDLSKRIGLVASLHQVTSYSWSVNGKNQAKKKEKPWVRHSEEVVRRGEGCCLPLQRESWRKNQSRVRHNEEVVRRGKEFAPVKAVTHRGEEEDN